MAKKAPVSEQRGTKQKPVKKITRLHPDTCGCIIEFSWMDDGEHHDEREITPHASIDHCEHHRSHTGDVHAHHHAIMAENKHKNSAIAHALEELPDEHKEVIAVDKEGNKTHWFKHHPEFSYNENRELQLHLHGVEVDTKQRINDSLNRKFAGKSHHVK